MPQLAVEDGLFGSRELCLCSENGKSMKNTKEIVIEAIDLEDQKRAAHLLLGIPGGVCTQFEQAGAIRL